MSDEAFRDISLTMNVRNVKTLYTGLVTKIHNRNGKSDSRILFIGDSCISFFTNKPKPTESRTFYWCDILDAQYIEDKFELEFSKDQELMKFISPEPEKVKKIIGFILFRFLTEDVQKNIHFEDFGKFEARPNGLILLARFISAELSNKVKLLPEVLKIITDFFKYNHTEITLPADKAIGTQLESLIFALNRSTNIKSIEIPEINPPAYTQLAKILPTIKTLNHINIIGSNFKGFPDFCTEISNLDKTSSVTGLSFEGAQFTAKQLTQLHDTLVNHGFKSLSFFNCVTEKTKTNFFDEFLDDKLFESIQMLNLDFTTILDINPLMMKATKLISLSLEDTGIDIFDVFTQLSQNQYPNLKMLNLKGNKCTKTIGNIKIDDACPLLRIDMKSVSWDSSCFTGVFKFISSREWPNGLLLDLSLAKYQELDFHDCIALLNGLQSGPLLHLSWSKNPINHEFIEFLKKNQNLFSINVTSCFKQGTLSQMQEFADFINQSNIQYLTMVGHGKDTIGEDMNLFFDKLESPKKLFYLDIKSQKFGTTGFDSLYKLIERTPSLQYINFTGANLKKLEDLFGFLTKVRTLGRKIRFDFPDDDLDSIMRENVFRAEEVTKIKWLLTDIATKASVDSQNQDGITRKIEGDPLDQPFDCFKMDSPYHFPIFMRDNLYFDFYPQLEYSVPKEAVIASTADITNLIYSENEEETIYEEDYSEIEKVTPVKSVEKTPEPEKKKVEETPRPPQVTPTRTVEEKHEPKKSPKRTTPKRKIHHKVISESSSDDYDDKIDTRYNKKHRGYPLPYPMPYMYPPPFYPPPPPQYYQVPVQYINPNQIQYNQMLPQPIQYAQQPQQINNQNEIEQEPVRKQKKAPQLRYEDNDSDNQEEKVIRKQKIMKNKKINWNFPIDKLQEIDTTEEFDNINAKFSFKNLVNDIM
ncbi:Leucine Rich Repeat family protein [Trichomonas vaginalis G3]|uniref:Leucine Rich Repeat family protein n=1 Tax=Trichomonas vaginalis (strain ATCC PRA-98 / G3) TaxID=412133 RepID=A2E8A2_TRIV3|nr:uncharacterized protein TVAGG3_1027050 [Trichomonas vaginalis G3]EAY11120.1 Leucine Rich Repeat family protein [Trichomonas vaginalis G3]KAI5492578.1 leucine-rich repeat, isoform f-related family [Trichomonas vaginalis G3]|eukprot:XP_001323343.1 hypothetical protein [Trichomonas vaginalis G3]